MTGWSGTCRSAKAGDTYDRYWIRVEEMKQSARIIAQCLDQLPEGPIMADMPSDSPGQTQRHAGHESLIHHFIIFTQGFKPPKGETYCGTEVPKGELGFFLISDGSPRPYRMKIRSAVVCPHGRVRFYGPWLSDF